MQDASIMLDGANERRHTGSRSSFPGSRRTIWQGDEGKAGLGQGNVVVVGDPERTTNGMDAVVRAAVGKGLDALIRGEDPRIKKLMEQLVHLSQEIEGRKRYGRANRVHDRCERTLRDLESVARGFPDPKRIDGAASVAAGEYLLNDCRVPTDWDDAVDPDCVDRGLLDADGCGTTLITDDGSDPQDPDQPTGPPVVIPRDGGGVAIPRPEGGQRIVRYDFQVNVNAVRCLRTTEGSDELAIEGLCTYESEPVRVDRYLQGGFEPVDPESDTGDSDFLQPEDYNVADGSLSTRPHRLLQVGVKYQPGVPTRLRATFIPSEVELSSIQRQQVTQIFEGLVSVATGIGLGALVTAAQVIPVVGQVVAGLIGSAFVSNQVNRLLRPYVLQLVSLFADPDMFSIYTLEASLMWSSPNRVPKVDYTVRGLDPLARGRDVSRVPCHPVDVSPRRVTSFVRTFQTRPVRPGVRRLGPGSYFTQFKTFARRVDFVDPASLV